MFLAPYSISERIRSQPSIETVLELKNSSPTFQFSVWRRALQTPGCAVAGPSWAVAESSVSTWAELAPKSCDPWNSAVRLPRARLAGSPSGQVSSRPAPAAASLSARVPPVQPVFRPVFRPVVRPVPVVQPVVRPVPVEDPHLADPLDLPPEAHSSLAHSCRRGRPGQRGHRYLWRLLWWKLWKKLGCRGWGCSIVWSRLPPPLQSAPWSRGGPSCWTNLLPTPGTTEGRKSFKVQVGTPFDSPGEIRNVLLG